MRVCVCLYACAFQFLSCTNACLEQQQNVFFSLSLFFFFLLGRNKRVVIGPLIVRAVRYADYCSLFETERNSNCRPTRQLRKKENDNTFYDQYVDGV